jgi:hypothetical protein
VEDVLVALLYIITQSRHIKFILIVKGIGVVLAMRLNGAGMEFNIISRKLQSTQTLIQIENNFFVWVEQFESYCDVNA